MAKDKKDKGGQATKSKEPKDAKAAAPKNLTVELVRRAEGFLEGRTTIAELMGLTLEQVYSLAHMGHTLLQEGNIEDALKVTKALVSINPKDPYLHLLLGSAHQQSGAKDEAIACYTKVIDLDSSFVEAYANRGEIYVEKGDLKKGLEDLKKAAQLDPKDENPATLRARAIIAVIVQKAEEQQSGKKETAKKK